MFTGLVEEIGEIIALERGDKSVKIKIKAKKVLENSKIGDSIATNGVCLTAVEIKNNYFVADCMYETIKRTNLKRLKTGDKVNLEKSLTLTSFLGGHLVTGDVDCEGKIISIYKEGIAKIYEIEILAKYMKYIVEKGRITVDGASLTVMILRENIFGVSLIPHSQKEIILGEKKVGDLVNIETDLFGKYVERILFFNQQEKTETKKESKLTEKFLIENGF